MYDEYRRLPSPPKLYATEPLELRMLTMADILAFRALRLDALRLHPEAFVPTYEEECAMDVETIALRFREDWIGGGNFILGAFLDGRLIGAVGVRGWPRAKQRHKATVWILFTDESVRGHGIGRQLLSAAIERTRHEGAVEQMHLSVGTESVKARRLYAELGFRRYGIEPRSIKLGDRYVDTELMVLDLGSSPAV